MMVKQGSIAWVTGASAGIGRATAFELARRGYRVAVSARREDALSNLAAEAAAAGLDIRPFVADVTDTASVASAIGAIEDTMGPIHLALLNAGIYEPVDGKSPELDAFRRSFQVNLMGTVNALVPLIERMKLRGSGHIAIVASVTGYTGMPTSAAYGATKAGLINMAESLKFDLDPLGIKIQVICPGFVETEATDKNEFPMPFIIPAAEAARRIADGLEKNGFEITFPRRFTYILKFGRVLPYSLYFPLARSIMGWPAPKK
jgi:NAD(P)-dependent dehydrogenase (short-subunit alcohol dehydrogenase family)